MGVFITGPSRSGTSMVAGLFAKHGVNFGECLHADQFNPKGYFENLDFKLDRWKPLQEPWGLKAGPEAWDKVKGYSPVVVVCKRDIKAIELSREVSHLKSGRGYAEAQIKLIEKIPYDIEVDTSQLVAYEFSCILPAFDLLGIEFNEKIAKEWIDPELWHW